MWVSQKYGGPLIPSIISSFSLLPSCQHMSWRFPPLICKFSQLILTPHQEISTPNWLEILIKSKYTLFTSISVKNHNRTTKTLVTLATIYRNISDSFQQFRYFLYISVSTKSSKCLHFCAHGEVAMWTWMRGLWNGATVSKAHWRAISHHSVLLGRWMSMNMAKHVNIHVSETLP